MSKETSRPDSADIKVVCPLPKVTVTLQELQEAQKALIKSVQWEHFCEELEALHNLHVTGEVTDRKATRVRNESLGKSSSLFRSDPYLDDDGLIRVGGRIKRPTFPQR